MFLWHNKICLKGHFSSTSTETICFLKCIEHHISQSPFNINSMSRLNYIHLLFALTLTSRFSTGFLMAGNSAHKLLLNIWPLTVFYGFLFVASVYLSVIHSAPVPQDFQKPHFQVSLNISAGIDGTGVLKVALVKFL